MTPQALTDALWKLETAGWPVKAFRTTRVGFALHIGRIPDIWFYPEKYKEKELWILEGWLRGQLEARGYRREVSAHLNLKKVMVQIISADTRSYVHRGEWYDTELEALVQACLAIADG